MKYFRLLLLLVILLVVYNETATAFPFQSFVGVAKSDTSTYRLYIAEAQMPLLKDTIFNREKCFVTHCPATLFNDSNDTLRYMVMSASWWDLYTLDNKNFEFAADWWNVFKNGQEVVVLPPHQSITRSISIITYKGYYRGQKLRIAMSLQRLGFELPDFLGAAALALKPKTTNLIWSNEVTVH